LFPGQAPCEIDGYLLRGILTATFEEAAINPRPVD
jgi:hypothetical protein